MHVAHLTISRFLRTPLNDTRSLIQLRSLTSPHPRFVGVSSEPTVFVMSVTEEIVLNGFSAPLDAADAVPRVEFLNFVGVLLPKLLVTVDAEAP